MPRKKKSNDNIVENVNDDIIKKIQSLGFDPDHNIAGEGLLEREYESEDDLFKNYAMIIFDLFKAKNNVNINPVTYITKLVLGFTFNDAETGSFFHLLDDNDEKPHFTISDFRECHTEILKSTVSDEKELKDGLKDTIYYFIAVMTLDGKYKVLSKELTDRILADKDE